MCDKDMKSCQFQKRCKWKLPHQLGTSADQTQEGENKNIYFTMIDEAPEAGDSPERLQNVFALTYTVSSLI